MWVIAMNHNCPHRKKQIAGNEGELLSKSSWTPVYLGQELCAQECHSPLWPTNALPMVIAICAVVSYIILPTGIIWKTNELFSFVKYNQPNAIPTPSPKKDGGDRVHSQALSPRWHHLQALWSPQGNTIHKLYDDDVNSNWNFWWLLDHYWHKHRVLRVTWDNILA